MFPKGVRYLLPLNLPETPTLALAGKSLALLMVVGPGQLHRQQPDAQGRYRDHVDENDQQRDEGDERDLNSCSWSHDDYKLCR